MPSIQLFLLLKSNNIFFTSLTQACMKLTFFPALISFTGVIDNSNEEAGVIVNVINYTWAFPGMTSIFHISSISSTYTVSTSLLQSCMHINKEKYKNHLTPITKM